MNTLTHLMRLSEPLATLKGALFSISNVNEKKKRLVSTIREPPCDFRPTRTLNMIPYNNLNT